MSVFWVDGRVPKPPIDDIIKSSIGIETEGYTHQLFFYYPKHGGIQALTDILEKSINKKITKNFEVKKICKKENKWVVNEEKKFDMIISTIPIFDIIKSIENIPKIVSDATEKLKYNSLITVNIGLNIDKLTDKHWVYIPDNELKTHRIIFLKNYSTFTCPKGRSSVLAEITYIEGDEISKMNDNEIINHVIDGLHKRKILDRNNVCYTRLERSKYAYVVYDVDYEKNIQIIYDFFKKIGIKLCGRFSEFKYYNMDACMRSAFDIANRI